MSANEQPAFDVRLCSRRVQRELDNLREAQYQRLIARLKALVKDPRPQGCERLYDDAHRVRVGYIRITYLIDEGNKRIEVGGIHRRSERKYKGIESLFQRTADS
jgi:mRNA-degrading endonuclease RelE of RelBE toxin-antitoxin system